MTSAEVLFECSFVPGTEQWARRRLLDSCLDAFGGLGSFVDLFNGPVREGLQLVCARSKLIFFHNRNKCLCCYLKTPLVREGVSMLNLVFGIELIKLITFCL